MMPGDKMRSRGAYGDHLGEPLSAKNKESASPNECYGERDRQFINLSEEAKSEPSLKMMGCTYDEQIEWSKFSLPVKSELHELLQQRISNFIHPDITIKIGKQEFGCHMLVLQCYSTFFEKLERDTELKELPESHITGRSFKAIYNWMIQPNDDSVQLLRRDNILEIFMAAQYLEIKELEDQCCSFIDNEDLFSEDTAFLLYLDARRLRNNTVMDLMVPRIQRFFLTLVSSVDWLQLDVEEVCIYLNSNYICIHCEMEVFMSGVRWLMGDWANRRSNLIQVMRCVRFGLIAPWQLVDIRRNPESPAFLEVTCNAEVSKMIEDGMAYAIVKQSHAQDSHDYNHWIELLGLSEPVGRNWAGNEKKYLAYQDFISELQLYRTLPLSSNNANNMQSFTSGSSSEDVLNSVKSPLFSAKLQCYSKLQPTSLSNNSSSAPVIPNMKALRESNVIEK